MQLSTVKSKMASILSLTNNQISLKTTLKTGNYVDKLYSLYAVNICRHNKYKYSV